MYWNGRRIAHGPYHGLAYDLIRRQIHTGALMPNEQLPAERKLAESLGISRATLRDALKRLEQEGYVVSVRGAKGGNFIANDEQLNEIGRAFLLTRPDRTWRSFEYLGAVLNAASMLACTRRTPADVKTMRDAVATVANAQSTGEIRKGQCDFITTICKASLNSFFVEAAELAMDGLFSPNPSPDPQQRADTLNAVLDAINQQQASQVATAITALLDELADGLLEDMMAAAID
jgi:GntR family transcriptional repressor for pyruvate dehydrogenase complex